jgi:hypothetical protein
MAELFERVAEPVAGPAMVARLSPWRGSWLRQRRVLGIDGFDVDLPDTPENAAEFGYAGSGEHRSAFPAVFFNAPLNEKPNSIVIS